MTVRDTSRVGGDQTLADAESAELWRDLRLGYTEADLADGGSDRLVDALVAWGSPERIAARLREHLDAGADHVAVQVVAADGGHDREAFRELAKVLF